MTPTALSNRTPEAVFTHHGQALGAEDLDALLMDYAPTATLVSPSGVLRGKDALRPFYVDLFQAFPKAKWRFTTTYADKALLLEWTADSARASASGVDTFIFENGLITLQTVHSTTIPKT